MFGKEPVGKYKNQIVNLIIVFVFVVVAINVHKAQTRNILLANEKKYMEEKKNKVLEDISQLEKKIDIFRNVVNNKDIYSVINTLGSLARDSAVKISSIKPSTEMDFPLYVRYPFDLTVEAGSYHAVGKFISKIESHPDIYTVESIEMAPSLDVQEGRLNKIIVNLKINTVLFKLK